MENKQIMCGIGSNWISRQELTVDLDALQEKYDRDSTAAALQMKALHDKYSLTMINIRGG
jgi:hypothetical protein